eukprot:scaffold61739_cov70-Phaeocystis_antarctica.AAC.1
MCVLPRPSVVPARAQRVRGGTWLGGGLRDTAARRAGQTSPPLARTYLSEAAGAGTGLQR